MNDGADTRSKAKVSSVPSKSLYIIVATLTVVLLMSLYAQSTKIAGWLVHELLSLSMGSSLAQALNFFIYDSVKIFVLLGLMIYAVGLIRARIDTVRIRDFLRGKNRLIGYALAAALGAFTPFCSCSSIPLFLGFTMVRIPIGITMTFLVTSPLINEVAVVLLWEMLGIKFSVTYVLLGLAVGIITGMMMDLLKADRWLQPFVLQLSEAANPPVAAAEALKTNYWDRHKFALNETIAIVRRICYWVLAGVAIGAFLHGYVPEHWFAEHFAKDNWWSVPAAVLCGIPLYSNVTGMVPVLTELLSKGMPIGTTLAFCMSTVAVSLPEMAMLKQVMTLKLLMILIGQLLLSFMLMGYLMNLLFI